MLVYMPTGLERANTSIFLHLKWIDLASRIIVLILESVFGLNSGVCEVIFRISRNHTQTSLLTGHSVPFIFLRILRLKNI